MDMLVKHAWPGNVRELQSAIKYALVHAAGQVLTADCLSENLRNGAALACANPAGPPGETLDVAALVTNLLKGGELDIYRKATLAVDRVVLDTVLRHVKGNQLQASELLGISRTTLRSKMRALGMAIEKQLLNEADQDG
jgi:two-component system nitrogen regulation response regulator GlnG